MRNPFRCFNSSPEVIRLTVMMYIHYLLSLFQVGIGNPPNVVFAFDDQLATPKPAQH